MYEQRKSAGSQGHSDSPPGLVYEGEVMDPVGGNLNRPLVWETNSICISVIP